LSEVTYAKFGQNRSGTFGATVYG